MHKPLRAAEKEDVRQLLASKADATVVSFPKSGRTWLSFMLTYYTTRFLGHAEADNLFVGDRIADIIPDRRKDFITFVMSARTRRHWAPVVMFSHQREQIVPRLKTKRNVLLVRDPRDIIVSYFHHVVGQGKGRRLEAAGLGRRPTISSFLQLEDFGFDNLLKYLDRWTTWADRTGTPKLYFEDIVADPEEEFRKFLSAVGFRPDQKLIAEAVVACTFDRLSQAESASSDRLARDPNARRFRRGRVGGHADEATVEDIDWMNLRLAEAAIPALARYT